LEKKNQFKAENAEVYANQASGIHALVSYGLIPDSLIFKISNSTIPPQGSYIYLGGLNIVNGSITITSSVNLSQIFPLLEQNNLIYTNGNIGIWYITPSH
jgi:uncharacterized membrane protein YdcZ (DUF606 family)